MKWNIVMIRGAAPEIQIARTRPMPGGFPALRGKLRFFLRQALDCDAACDEHEEIQMTGDECNGMTAATSSLSES